MTTRFDQDLVVFENEYQRLSDEDLKRMYADAEEAYNQRPRQRSFAEVMDRRINQKGSEEMRESVRRALKIWQK